MHVNIQVNVWLNQSIWLFEQLGCPVEGPVVKQFLRCAEKGNVCTFFRKDEPGEVLQEIQATTIILRRLLLESKTR
jgi:hypothetical protein